MVCVPCLVVPFLLWILHRFFLPILLPFFPSLQAKFGQQQAVEHHEVNVSSTTIDDAPNSSCANAENKKDL
uniref:Secreted protein n=1 Tax=Mesocestoides corti TaxID=53468 RepID=A0A5K3FK78_MESCO